MGAQTLSVPQTVIIHHLIVLIPLWLSVQLSVETMIHNTTITSHPTVEPCRPLQLREEIWLQRMSISLGLCVNLCACISTHRVGIVGIGPWPTRSWAPT